MDLALELVSDMAAGGLVPSHTLCSGMVHACLRDKRLDIARNVYDLMAVHGCYPELSQYNRMMEWCVLREGRVLGF